MTLLKLAKHSESKVIIHGSAVEKCAVCIALFGKLASERAVIGYCKRLIKIIVHISIAITVPGLIGLRLLL